MLDDAEWRDAAVHELPGLARLHVKQSDGFVWLAIELTRSDNGSIDLYLAPSDGSIHDLHASAKLGERALHAGQWPDWQWWNNRGWVADVSRLDVPKTRTFLPYPAGARNDVTKGWMTLALD